MNKPQQEGITTKPGDKELFILILQKPVIIIRGFYRFSVVSSGSLSLFTNWQSQMESSINIILIFAPTIILLQVIPVN